MQSINVDIPGPVFESLSRRAEDAQRTVADMARELIVNSVPLDDGISPAVALELAKMPEWSDAELWDAARMRVPTSDSDRLEELNFHGSAGTLTPAERDEQRSLLANCDRVMLVRAQAAVLLKERGHDISVLLQP